jgi:aspartyl-tRNA(Asn)/glutamyl-tRNA(Gln) amidotransferase subunit A
VSADLGGYDVDAEVRANLHEAAAVFVSLGAQVQEAGLHLDREAVCEAARAHFAAIFGGEVRRIALEHRDLMTSYAIAFAEDAAAPTVGFYRGLEIESEVHARVADVLEVHDVLVTPVFGLPALGASAADYDIEVLYRHGMTLVFNICSRCPVLVVPCGRSRDGVPLGVQLVGRTYDDVTVFRAAAAFAAARPWFRDPAPRPALAGN